MFLNINAKALLFWMLFFPFLGMHYNFKIMLTRACYTLSLQITLLKLWFYWHNFLSDCELLAKNWAAAPVESETSWVTYLPQNYLTILPLAAQSKHFAGVAAGVAAEWNRMARENLPLGISGNHYIIDMILNGFKVRYIYSIKSVS